MLLASSHDDSYAASSLHADDTRFTEPVMGVIGSSSDAAAAWNAHMLSSWLSAERSTLGTHIHLRAGSGLHYA